MKVKIQLVQIRTTSANGECRTFHGNNIILFVWAGVIDPSPPLFVEKNNKVNKVHFQKLKYFHGIVVVN